ncbi:hypothetical protein LEN26_016882 [Aphanomyces euteiches]|nr:hypothetical protein LEN26_016882 [Aphanomyces euteiches]KAH9113532.1 hypothetical protein AeMF1_012267 [Aphanomyces euteiches]KAH9184029.1 hypothetical protein AeNC1_013991 [Aphanomyces euteiches]
MVFLTKRRAVIARWFVVLTALVAFVGSTKLTGFPGGDLCFLASFVVFAYSALQAYSMTHEKILLLSRTAQLVFDVLIALLMVVGALTCIMIGLPFTDSYGLGLLATIFVFFACIAQMIVVAYIRATPAAGTSNLSCDLIIAASPTTVHQVYDAKPIA